MKQISVIFILVLLFVYSGFSQVKKKVSTNHQKDIKASSTSTTSVSQVINLKEMDFSKNALGVIQISGLKDGKYRLTYASGGVASFLISKGQISSPIMEKTDPNHVPKKTSSLLKQQGTLSYSCDGPLCSCQGDADCNRMFTDKDCILSFCDTDRGTCYCLK